MKKVIYYLVILGCFSSCNLLGKKEIQSIEQLKEYMSNPDNGLIDTKQVGNFELSAQYLPPAYLHYINDGNDQEYSPDIETELSGQFLLKIGSKEKGIDALALGVGSTQEYQDRVSYLVSYIPNDMVLISGSDTLKCMMHHYERNYNLADFHNVLLVFDVPPQLDKAKEIKLVFNDQVLGVGRIIFSFNTNDIQNIPTIKL